MVFVVFFSVYLICILKASNNYVIVRTKVVWFILIKPLRMFPWVWLLCSTLCLSWIIPEYIVMLRGKEQLSICVYICNSIVCPKHDGQSTCVWILPWPIPALSLISSPLSCSNLKILRWLSLLEQTLYNLRGSTNPPFSLLFLLQLSVLYFRHSAILFFNSFFFVSS